MVAVIFRSEISILLGTHALNFAIRRRKTMSFQQDILLPGLIGLVIGLSLTVPIDSYFWLCFPLWPELSGFLFNVLHGQSSNWGTSPLLFYFTSALPRLFFNPLTYLICAPVTIAIPHMRSQALSILIPNLAFVIIYSFQPHKEWRFIIYIIPPLLTLPAAGASWIWTRRTKSRTYMILVWLIIISSIASITASLGMLAISSLNYPGAEALNRMHELSAAEKGQKHVHMDTLSCVNGVTRFLQILPSNITDERTGWVYDKTEDPKMLLHPAFWDKFDYALAETPERVIGKWEIVHSVDGFAGVVLLPPMEGTDMALPWFNDAFSVNRQAVIQNSKPILGFNKSEIANILKVGEHWVRKHITRGWWIGVKMETKLRVLKKQREHLKMD